MLHIRAFSLLLLIFTLCVGTIDAAEPGGQDHVERIEKAGLETTRASLEKYLRGLDLNEDVRTRIGQLLKQLDSDSFHEREDASKQLAAMPVLPLEAVREAARSDNPETRLRAQKILKRYSTTQVTRPDMVYSVFKAIQYGRVDVPLAAILETVPHCDRRLLVHAALAAAKKVRKPADEAQLRKYLTHSEPSLRSVACEVLGDLLQSQGKPTDPAIVAMLTDEDERTRVTAARAVADGGDRRCLNVLVSLLHAKSQEVRITAINALRSATGQRFAYAAHGDRARRAGAVIRWQQWLTKHGDAAKLSFPLKADDQRWGRILVCFKKTHRIVEFDSSRKIVWKKEGIKYPRACVGTPSGERIVIHDNRIVTYDAAGIEVPKTERVPGNPRHLARTPEGNLIVLTTMPERKSPKGRIVVNRIFEIGSDGKTAHQFDITGESAYATDLQVLPNGNLLVSLGIRGEVIEYDRQGREISNLSQLKQPRYKHSYSARRLPNGNTLVAVHSKFRVVEFDRDLKEVWSAKVAAYPRRAIALENGNILVAWIHGISEINRKGKEVWSKQLGQVSDIARY